MDTKNNDTHHYDNKNNNTQHYETINNDTQQIILNNMQCVVIFNVSVMGVVAHYVNSVGLSYYRWQYYAALVSAF